MKDRRALIVLIATLLLMLVALGLVAQMVQGANLGASSGNVDYFHATYGNVAGVISAGDAELFIQYTDTANEPDDAITVSTLWTGPSATTPTATFTVSNAEGCTVSNGGTLLVTTGIFSANRLSFVNLTSALCSFVIQVQVQAGVGATTIWNTRHAVVIETGVTTLRGGLTIKGDMNNTIRQDSGDSFNLTLDASEDNSNNQLLEFVKTFGLILLFFVFAGLAFRSKDGRIFPSIAAIVIGVYAIVALWEEISGLRIGLICLVILVVADAVNKIRDDW